MSAGEDCCGEVVVVLILFWRGADDDAIVVVVVVATDARLRFFVALCTGVCGNAYNSSSSI